MMTWAVQRVIDKVVINVLDCCYMDTDDVAFGRLLSRLPSGLRLHLADGAELDGQNQR